LSSQTTDTNIPFRKSLLYTKVCKN